MCNNSQTINFYFHFSLRIFVFLYMFAFIFHFSKKYPLDIIIIGPFEIYFSLQLTYTIDLLFQRFFAFGNFL